MILKDTEKKSVKINMLTVSDSEKAEFSYEGYFQIKNGKKYLIYTDENEHAIDSMNLALLIFEQKYGELLKKVFSIKTIFIGTLDNRDVDVKSRAISETDEETVFAPIAPSSQYGIIGITGIKQSRNKRAMSYQRRSF